MDFQWNMEEALRIADCCATANGRRIAVNVAVMYEVRVQNSRRVSRTTRGFAFVLYGGAVGW
jgi:hypothetical protein